MSDTTAALPQIPPVGAIRDLARSVGNGTVRLDPVAAEAFLRELTAVRDEVLIIRQDARLLFARKSQFGASSTATIIGQKFVDRADDFVRALRCYHQVITDLEATARRAVANWTDTDTVEAARFGNEGPR